MSAVVGRRFTATLRVESADVATTMAGAPLEGGTLVVNFNWLFQGGSDGTVTVAVPAVMSFTMNAGVENDRTITVNGYVPAPPAKTPNGFSVPFFAKLAAVVGEATNAVAQSSNTLTVSIDQGF